MLYQLAYSQRAILIVLLAFLVSIAQRKERKKVGMNELGIVKRLSEVSQYQEVKYRYRISFHSTLVGVCEWIRTGDLGGFPETPNLTFRPNKKKRKTSKKILIEELHNKNLFSICDLSCVSSCLFIRFQCASKSDFYSNCFFVAD